MKQPPERQKRPLRRRVYLLTCWQERDGLAGRELWRFSLETLNTSERRLFKTLREVMAAIEAEMYYD